LRFFVVFKILFTGVKKNVEPSIYILLSLSIKGLNTSGIEVVAIIDSFGDNFGLSILIYSTFY
jgi:hypothetical protein